MDGVCFPLPTVVNVAIKGSLIWTCAASLLMKKWYHDGPDRSYRDLALDGSKQLVGCTLVAVFSRRIVTCDSYWASVVAETTVELPIKYLLLVVLTHLFQTGSEYSGSFRTGEYRDKNGKWIRGSYTTQLIIWLACVTGANFLRPLLSPPLLSIGSLFLKFFSWSKDLEILVVTLFSPCFLYALQVWVSDDFLKKETKERPGIAWRLLQRYLPGSCLSFLDKLLDVAPPRPKEQPKKKQVQLPPPLDNLKALQEHSQALTLVIEDEIAAATKTRELGRSTPIRGPV